MTDQERALLIAGLIMDFPQKSAPAIVEIVDAVIAKAGPEASVSALEQLSSEQIAATASL